MENAKQLFEWYNNLLQQKCQCINHISQFNNGVYFIKIISKYHPKFLDSSFYLLPQKQSNILQNFQYLSNLFVRLGWMQLQSKKYLERKEADILQLASYIKHKLSQQSNQISQLKVELKVEQKRNRFPYLKHNEDKSTQILRLKKKKEIILSKIMQIQLLLKYDPDKTNARQTARKLELSQNILRILNEGERQ